MKLSLQLKIGQHLTMTPQLQQAIRLLQLSTLELQEEVQDALESNPMLEQDEGSTEAIRVQPPTVRRRRIVAATCWIRSLSAVAVCTIT